MSISNPISVYVNGQETKEFTHEGGSKPLHFSARDNGLSFSEDLNVIFFADDEKHAKSVLTAMFQHVIDCNQEYIENKKEDDVHGFTARAKEKMKTYKSWLQMLKQDKIKINAAPTGQFYKVGWAFNDTI